jgi:hypothetical protein
MDAFYFIEHSSFVYGIRNCIDLMSVEWSVMKRFACVFSILMCFAAFAADAAIYKWKDASGRVNFGDRPVAQASQVKIVQGGARTRTDAGTLPVASKQSTSNTSLPVSQVKPQILAQAAQIQPTPASSLPVTQHTVNADKTFPRLLGMNIGEKNYQDVSYQHALARLDVVILGFYKGWTVSGATIGSVVKSLKALNPDILVGQYTILSEAYEKDGKHLPDYDKVFKLDKEKWWLRKADGSKVQWTNVYEAWQTNISDWTQPDFNGDRYPEWLAKRDYQAYFRDAPDIGVWYFDNVGQRPEVRLSDWNRDGQDDDANTAPIAAAYRRGHAAEWNAANQLAPNVLRMGNISVGHDLGSPEYRGKLNGAFMEGMMGYLWSTEKWAGWGKMMDLYHSVFPNLAAPAIVGFNVSGKPNDYRFFRYAYTSCLMDDGYFSFTDETVGYSSVPWFDEYDVRLGRAVDAPQAAPWQSGVYRRVFEQGMVLVNPTVHSVTVNVGAGYKRFTGKQDAGVNSGASAVQITISPRDGIVLVKQNPR